MQRMRLLTLVVLFALVLGPVTAFAQEEPELQEFVSEDGLLTFMYPADWAVQENTEEVGLPGAMLANSEEALETVVVDGVFAEGQQGIVVLLVPTELLGLMGVTIEEDLTTEELTQLLVDNFQVGGEGGGDAATAEPGAEATVEPGATQYGEVEVVTFEDEREAGFVTVTQEDLEGGLYVLEVTEGVIALVYVGVFPGEFDEDVQAIAFTVASTLQYTGTAEDLMNTLMGGGIEEPVPATEEATGEAGGDTGAETSDHPGNALVNERCTVCHTRERIDAQDKDEAGWTATVDRMIGNGAQLNEEERQLVIDYLVETH